MFGGGIGTYLYTALGGLDTVSNATSSGWQHIKAGPAAAAAHRLPFGRAQVATRFGRAAVSWVGGAASLSETTTHFTLNATIPSGATGMLKVVMLGEATDVYSDSTPVWKDDAFIPNAVPGLISASLVNEEGFQTILFEVTSGVYHLEAVSVLQT
jgi:hypothetical protein